LPSLVVAVVSETGRLIQQDGVWHFAAGISTSDQIVMQPYDGWLACRRRKIMFVIGQKCEKNEGLTRKLITPDVAAPPGNALHC
jgi:hypothetical protein